jgi:hypothetical protein
MRMECISLLSELALVAGLKLAVVEKPNKPNYLQRPIDLAGQV